jgi:hypothetical protein
MVRVVAHRAVVVEAGSASTVIKFLAMVAVVWDYMDSAATVSEAHLPSAAVIAQLPEVAAAAVAVLLVVCLLADYLVAVMAVYIQNLPK